MVSPAASGFSRSPDTMAPMFTMAIRILENLRGLFRRSNSKTLFPPHGEERGRRPRVSNHEAAKAPQRPPSSFETPAFAARRQAPQDEGGDRLVVRRARSEEQ